MSCEEEAALGDATKCGAGIFRGLPSYTTFNKPFVDPSDMLFLDLNEISPSNWNKNDGLFSFHVKSESTPTDHVEQPNSQIQFKRYEVFYYPTKSQMSTSVHMAHIRILQGCSDDDDAAVWDRVRKTRELEAKQFQNLVKEFELMEGCSLYLPTLDLIDLYKKCYTADAKRIMQLEEDLAYNTRFGLPLVHSQYISQNDVELTDVECVARRGLVPMWDDVRQINWRDIKVNLKELSKLCVQADTVEQKLCEEFKKIPELLKYADEQHKFYIPLDALAFLLTPAESHDLSREVLVVIQKRAVHGDKLIYFDKPLPSRACGWHTNKTAFEKACMAHLSLCENIRWLRLVDSEAHLDTAVQCEKKYKINAACVKWALRDTNTSNALNIYTTLTLPPTCGEKATCFLADYSFKLEYKPQFGAEWLTKYELIKMWLKTTLMSGHTKTLDGVCVRVSVKNFDPIVEQSITATQIAQQLRTLYNIEVHRLIAGLSGFLKLVSKNPAGKYLLRYTPKYTEQLLLCASTTKDIRESTVHLHKLLKTQASSGVFMRTQHHFPICEDLCTRMHTEYKVMPCAFRPHQPGARVSKCPPFQFLNDRTTILRRSSTSNVKHTAPRTNVNSRKWLYRAKNCKPKRGHIKKDKKED